MDGVPAGASVGNFQWAGLGVAPTSCLVTCPHGSAREGRPADKGLVPGKKGLWIFVLQLALWHSDQFCPNYDTFGFTPTFPVYTSHIFGLC